MCLLTARLTKVLQKHAVDILLTVAIIIGIYVFASDAARKAAESTPQTIETVVVLYGVSSSNLPAEGEVLYSEDGSKFGTVTQTDAVAATQWKPTTSGGKVTYEKVYVSGKDITLTVSVDAIKSGNGFSVCGEPLLIGTVRRLHTAYFTGDAHITVINTQQSEGE